MTEPETPEPKRKIPRNLWAVSGTSFFMDTSSEMIMNVLPLFLSNVLGVGTAVIGLIEGVAESTASLLKVFFGSLSDRMGARKPLAVSGYALSALAKPLFLLASSWGMVAGARWADRVGKGVRTAPRDALIADSIGPSDRGLAFGLHRAADTGGAALGLLIAIAVVAHMQGSTTDLSRETFQTLVLVSLIPALLAVLTLLLGVRETRRRKEADPVRIGFRGLGRRFAVFLGIIALFDLGNFSDAFLVLRAQERGLGVDDLLWTLLGFNLVYAVVSTPAGALSDRIGRRRLIVAGWIAYALIYLGFAVAGSETEIVALYLCYGAYYGLTVGTAKAMVADLVPARLRGTAFGTFHAVLGVIDLPASLIAGVLWQGAGSWQGFGPAAPFYFGAATSLGAALLMMAFLRDTD
ncbi:MAG: MFS transporter [bacterium]|nr:MFS transporter [bacterium]